MNRVLWHLAVAVTLLRTHFDPNTSRSGFCPPPQRKRPIRNTCGACAVCMSVLVLFLFSNTLNAL